ncbi:MAG: enoyl-CoA hydratase/isomerase family protein, partial [Candidatus Latescibacterota bacterium]
SGQNWYPPNHFRPLVDWKLDSEEAESFKTWILGPIFQMASLMLHEKRAHLSNLNIIGELCAQFRKGILALIREHGPEATVKTVEAYHALHPEAAGKAWHPETFETIGNPEWQQLYVNAEHDGTVGVLTIGRESYNHDVNAELNRAIGWLQSEGIERVIVTGDFHLSTQLIGADTSDFFQALENADIGFKVAHDWSLTARRLHDEFKTSVGLINGKRCLGGMLELMMHCHYLVALDDADLGMPEVTLPVVPGMEGCHWPFRKAAPKHRIELLNLLLSGRSIKAKETVGWLADFTGPMHDALAMSWKIATGGDHGLQKRIVKEGALKDIPDDISALPEAGDPGAEAARLAILNNIQSSCGTTLSEALAVQANHSAGFMNSKECLKGAIGAAYTKTMNV